MSEEINKITEGIDKLKESVDAKLEITKKELGEEYKKEIKGAIAEELKGLEKMQAQLDALEVDSRKNFNKSPEATLIDELEKAIPESAQLKAFKEGSSNSARINLKADMTTAANASGEAAIAYRRNGILYDPSRPVHIRSLMQVIPTGQTNTVRHIQEGTFTDAASTRNESGLIAQSSFVTQVVDTAIRSVGHRIDLPVEMFEDINGLPAYINARLPEKLMEEEDSQILLGAGTAPDLNGLMVASIGVTAFDEASTGYLADAIDGAQKYDVLVAAINQLNEINYYPTGIVVRPSDYHKMLLLKDTTNAYIRDPQTGLLTVLGVPVYKSNALTADKFLVCDFNTVGYLANRKGMSLEFSKENGDNFEKDLITVKATERIANVIERPNAGVWGDFSDAAAALETP